MAATKSNTTLSVWSIELLLRLNCSQTFVSSMNTSLDYSFVNTTITDAPISSNTTVIPRASEQNSRLPAYLDGQVIWGGRPAEVRRYPRNAHSRSRLASSCPLGP